MIDISAPVCCAPVAAGPMSDEDALHVALRLKALADPVRVKIVSFCSVLHLANRTVVIWRARWDCPSPL
jgi:hypothetical protein